MFLVKKNTKKLKSLFKKTEVSELNVEKELVGGLNPYLIMKGECVIDELNIFKNEEFGEVRFVEFNGKPYFVANDVARALGYKRPADAVSSHCKGSVKRRYLTSGGEQEVKVIPEGDIYRLVARSKLPAADKFESWVFDEVLPQIRKNGGYVANDDLFINTYLPFADDSTKLLFKSTLSTVRSQNEIIQKQQKEIEHKEDVIIGLVDEITLAEKRQILNRVVRYNNSNYRDRWNLLYREFENKYHLNLSHRLKKYNQENKPKCKSKIDYIDIILNKIPELYELATKLFENDVKELVDEMYRIAF